MEQKLSESKARAKEAELKLAQLDEQNKSLEGNVDD
jgi:hypothetical protein